MESSMDVGALCLGVLSFGDTSGYGIRRAVEDWFRHFGHASLGAIYPALAKLTARGAVEVIGARDAPLEKRVFRITEVGRSELAAAAAACAGAETPRRSEEHTSELQSLMRRSYAVFCLKKKNN